MLPHEENPRKLPRWDNHPLLSSHRGKPRTVSLSLQPPPSNTPAVDVDMDEEEDNLHLQNLIALARLPFCPETRTFASAPPPLVAVTPRQPSTLTASSQIVSSGRKGGGTTQRDNNNATVTPSPETRRHTTFRVETANRTQEEEEGSLDIAHSDAIEKSSNKVADPQRASSSPIVLLDDSDEEVPDEEEEGGVVGDDVNNNMQPDGPDPDASSVDPDPAADRDRIVAENRAFVASQFGFFDPIQGAARSDKPRQCRVCGAKVVSRRGNRELLRHALTTACLIRRAFERGARNDGSATSRTTLKTTTIAPRPSDAADDNNRRFEGIPLEMLSPGSRASVAIRRCWEPYFNEDDMSTTSTLAMAAPDPDRSSSMSPKSLSRQTCRRCSRQVGPPLYTHLIGCVGIVPLLHAVDEALLPICARAMKDAQLHYS